MAKKAFVDLGHFKSDSGAVGNGLREVDINTSYGNALASELARHGVDVMVGQGGSLDNRCAEANKWGADIFISNHTNAGGGDGFEVFIYGRGGQAEVLANKVYDQVVNIDKLNNGRGVKTANFAVLRGTSMPAILIESAFIDTKDIQCIDEKHEQIAFGKSIAKGVLKHLDITYKPESTSTPSTGETYYRVVAGSYKDRANAEATMESLKKDGYSAFLLAYTP